MIMTDELLLRPALFDRVINAIRYGLPTKGRLKRYFLTILPGLAVIWVLTAGYIMLAPPSYSSKFTLILPGSGAGGSLNVESIGQAQSTASSAFSSSTLSPTENYKRLLTADVTLRKAARLIAADENSFPAPTVRLTDQTNLIEVEIEGSSAAQANKRATALHKAFLEQLEMLRVDEAKSREVSDMRHLKDLEVKVGTAQRKLIEFQAENGLVSLEQFNNRIAGIDALREKERETRTILTESSAKAAQYSNVLGVRTDNANRALRLKSDPVFQRLADYYAQLAAKAEEKSATLGPAHAEMAQADSERSVVRGAMIDRGRELTGLSEKAIMREVDLSLSEGRSNLVENMIVSGVNRTGTAAALDEIRDDLSREKSLAGGLVTQASVLADLTRDHRIAEAVFSSSLARLDTNKQDPFASYPLVQTLEAPSIPRQPSSPSALIAIVAAFAASLFLVIGIGLIWLRQSIIRRIFPNG
jgi:uncharacterized protein involved in exopolysaccharide biosynthesis